MNIAIFHLKQRVHSRCLKLFRLPPGCTRRLLAFVLLVGSPFALPSLAPGQSSTAGTNKAFAGPVPTENEVGIEQRIGARLPLELNLRDATGQTVRLQRFFRDRPVILVPVYFRCPRLCSVVLDGLVQSLSRVDYSAGIDFEVVVVSFDPRETTERAAAKKAQIVDRYQRPTRGKGWHFLTGSEKEIRQLTDAIGFHYRYDSGRGEYAHASGIMILTSDGVLSRYFFGVDFSPRDVSFGLEDASRGALGSAITQPVRLLCFAYDPLTGKYALMAMRLVRLGGLLTILAFCGFFFWNWRRAPTQPRTVAIQPELQQGVTRETEQSERECGRAAAGEGPGLRTREE